MTFVVEASGLGRQYGRHWALRDCTLAIPAGRVVRLLAPTSGSIRVLGASPGDGPAQLGRVGFVG
jgi:ABC-2 type transport system ATP-binding protein